MKRLLFLFVLLFTATQMAHSQSTAAVVITQDLSGRAVPGATVTLVQFAVRSYTAQSDFAGVARFPNIVAGTYTVQITGPGITTESYLETFGASEGGTSPCVSNPPPAPSSGGTFFVLCSDSNPYFISSTGKISLLTGVGGTVITPPTAPTIVLSPLSYTFQGTSLGFGSGYVGVPYAGQISASGGTVPYTFSITGSLPAGVTAGSCSGTGSPVCTFAGTPTTAGTSSFTVNVSDVGGFKASYVASLTVYSTSSVAVTPTGQSISSGSNLQMRSLATESDSTVLDVTNSATWASSAGGTINTTGLFTAGGGGGGGSFSLIQAPALTSCSGASCNITVSSTGSGHAIKVTAYFSSAQGQISSISGGGTYTLCPGSSALVDGTFCSMNLPWWIDTGYTLNSTSGTTTITVSLNSAIGTWAAGAAEIAFSGAGSSIQFDAGAPGSDSACTSCLGVSLSSFLTGSLDYIFQDGNPTNSLSAITSPYTNPALFGVEGMGSAGSINTTSGTAPTWTQSSSGNNQVSAIAFRGVNGGAANPSVTATFNGKTSSGDAITVTGSSTTFACSGVVTSSLQSAINTAAGASKTLEITPGSCTSGPLTLPNNTSLKIDANVTVSDVAGYTFSQKMLNISSSNVTITGAGSTSIFQMPLSQAASIADGSEYRHCLDIEGGASNVTVSGISCNQSGGDGFYINGATNVTVQDSFFDQDYRNGGSITGGVNHIFVLRNHLTRATGTIPESGIDVEPNVPGDFLEDVHLDSNFTDNNGVDGIEFSLQNLTNATAPISVFVTNHHSDNNGRYGYFMLNNDPTNPGGTITVSNSFSQGDGSCGVNARFWQATGTQLNFQNLTVTNPHAKGPDPSYGSRGAVCVIRGGGQSVAMGNVSFTGTNISITNGASDHYFDVEDFSNIGISNIVFDSKGAMSGATAVPPNGLENGSGVSQLP